MDRIDSKIEHEKEKVQQLKHKVVGVEATVRDAQIQAAAFQKSTSETLVRLRQVSSQIRRSRERASQLKTKVKAVMGKGHTAEVFYLLRELKIALTWLGQLVEAADDGKLVERLLEEWRGSESANAIFTKNTTALAQMKRDLAERERELQQKIQSREADVMAALNDSSVAEAISSPPSSDTGVERKRTTRTKKTAR